MRPIEGRDRFDWRDYEDGFEQLRQGASLPRNHVKNQSRPSFHRLGRKVKRAAAKREISQVREEIKRSSLDIISQDEGKIRRVSKLVRLGIRRLDRIDDPAFYHEVHFLETNGVDLESLVDEEYHPNLALIRQLRD